MIKTFIFKGIIWNSLLIIFLSVRIVDYVDYFVIHARFIRLFYFYTTVYGKLRF